MTQSEKNVIDFFRSIGIELVQIPETDTETPDYKTSISGVEIFIEVKEIIENDYEKDVLKKTEDNTHQYSFDVQPMSKRVRGKITKADCQLKKLCIANQPGILIIQDLRSFFTRSLIPSEEVKQAMFGEREIWVSMPSFGVINKSKITADIFGKNKSNTKSKNRNISAVCLLVDKAETRDSSLFIYHNPYAKNPLPHKLIDHSNVKEFVIPSTRSYCHYEKV
ncbi:MAG: hypothetical protein ABFD81_08740 [Syntrophaceae bacterium]